MANNRTYWAIESFSIAPADSTSYVTVHGLQQVGITTSFNLEQVFEKGQLEIYQNVENIPDVEVSMTKVIDGYPLIYHLATRGAPNGTLSGRANQKCMVLMNVYGDTQNSASGTPISEVVMSGMYISSVSYTIPVDGNCTEEVTIVGNNKEWRTSNYLVTGNSTPFDNTDQPLAYASGWGGVQRRQNVDFITTRLPAGNYGGIDGISSSGTNDRSAGVNGAHVTNISVKADLGREPMYELGRKGPYFRFVNFPVEVQTDIEINGLRGDMVSASEDGVVPNSGINLTDKTIYIKLQDGTTIDCGSRNKLSNVSYGGADAGGGNASITYSYVGYNNFTITHPQDPG